MSNSSYINKHIATKGITSVADVMPFAFYVLSGEKFSQKLAV